MKNLLFAVAVLCTATNASAQFASSQKQNTTFSYSSPLRVESSTYSNPPGLKMKRTGTTLTVLGSILLVGGVAMASTADELYYSSNTTNGNTVEEGDPQGGFGVVMIAAGVGMMVPGIIFWSKGARKLEAYRAEQSASIRLQGAGVTLRLKF